MRSAGPSLLDQIPPLAFLWVNDVEEAKMRVLMRCALLSLFLFAVILGDPRFVGGLSPKTVKVQGIVTLDGKQVPKATVTFLTNRGGAGRRAGLTDSGRDLPADHLSDGGTGAPAWGVQR